MQKWLITPRDPLIFRNGKPFTAAPGSRSETLPIPFPSTIAGAVRTRAGLDPVTGIFQSELINNLLGKTIFAPILAEINNDNQIVDYLLPAPADAIFFKTSTADKASLYDLKPLDLGDAMVDLPELSICGPEKIIKDKPHPRMPTFWRWEKIKDWLELPESGTTFCLNKIGIQGLVQESRTHVSIDPGTQAAEEGALFQTSGLEFTHQDRKDSEPYCLSKSKQLGLLVLTNADMKEGIGHLGGESRTVSWVEKEALQMPFETCPEAIFEKIMRDGHCRLILITPAYFEHGNTPTWLQDQFKVTVKAIINKRYLGISGWDYEKKAPKPSRRLTPAGSVYFLKLPDDKKQCEDFIKNTWMRTISDDPKQNRLDGFGLAILGVWDGTDRKMKMEDDYGT